jgi:hypothetical protein
MIELTNRAPIRSKESRIFFSGRGSSFLILWEMPSEKSLSRSASSTKIGIGKSAQKEIIKQMGCTQTNPYLSLRHRWQEDQT